MTKRVVKREEDMRQMIHRKENRLEGLGGGMERKAEIVPRQCKISLDTRSCNARDRIPLHPCDTLIYTI